MPHQKILGQAGESLTTQYDIEGSAVTLGELDSESVKTVHEMGATIFSERIVGTLETAETGDLLQNVAFAATIAALAQVPMLRVLGIMVTVDTVARLDDCVVSLRSQGPDPANEIPIWVWDETNEDTVRVFLDGTLADQNSLRPRPEYTTLPSLMIGFPQPQRVNSIACRGNTSGFGAGTVKITVKAYLAFPRSPALGSGGLPIPSW